MLFIFVDIMFIFEYENKREYINIKKKKMVGKKRYSR